jgi:hypothetical protein
MAADGQESRKASREEALYQRSRRERYIFLGFTPLCAGDDEEIISFSAIVI